MAVTNFLTSYELQMELPEDDNFTYDYEYNNNHTTFCDEEEAQQTFQAVFQPLLYSLIFLLGVAGNGLMITVLLRRRHLLRITEIYLLHLALADLMLLLTFPFDVAEHAAGWLFGDFLCRVKGLLQNLNIHCGSFLLACIGFDRYLAIVHAIPSMQTRRPRTVHLTCMSIWLVCFALSIPDSVFLSVKEMSENSSWLSCSYHLHLIHGNNWVLTNRVFDHLCFFLPLAVMSYCYTAVVVTLYKSQTSKAKQGAIRLALLVTLVFFFCWLPYNITLLLRTMADLDFNVYDNCGPYVLLQPALDVTKSLGLSHCCLNPFLYAFIGVRFRNDLIQLLCKLGCSRLFLPFIGERRHSRASISEGVTTTSTIL